MAKPEEVPTKVIYSKTDVYIDKDGKKKIEYEVHSIAQNEKGVKDLSEITYHNFYLLDKFTILSVEVITDGKTYTYDTKKVKVEKNVERPGSYSKGYTKYTVHLDNVKVGSVIKRKVLYEGKYPFHIFNKAFEINFTSEHDYFIETSIINVTSEIPFYYFRKSPKSDDWIKKGPMKNYQIIEKNWPDTLFLDEPKSPWYVLHPKHFDFLSIKRFSKWEEYASPKAKQYETLYNKPLPKKFDSILEKAKKKKTQKEQINCVLEHLSKKLAYKDIPKSYETESYPKSLDQIAKDGWGTCKEYGLVAVAILRRLGFKAFPCVVNYPNQWISVTNPDIVPHLIVKAIDKNNDVHWIEPQMPFYLEKYEIYFDADVYVLDPKGPYLDHIPPSTPEDSEVFIDRKISKEKKKKTEDIKLSVKGTLAQYIYAISYENAQEHPKERNKAFCDNLDQILSLPNKRGLNNFSCKVSSFRTKNNGELDFNLHFTHEDDIDVFEILPYPDYFTEHKEEYVSDLIIGAPKKITEKITLKGMKVSEYEDRAVQTQWMDAKVVVTDSLGTIVTETKIKKPFISSELYKTEEFKKLKMFYT